MLSFSIVSVILVFFATYRLSMMLHHDDELGPSQVLARLKFRLGVMESDDGSFFGHPGSFQEALLCYFCNSPYIGLLLSFVVVVLFVIDMEWLAQLMLFPFAASGFTILLARYTER